MCIDTDTVCEILQAKDCQASADENLLLAILAPLCFPPSASLCFLLLPSASICFLLPPSNYWFCP